MKKKEENKIDLQIQLIGQEKLDEAEKETRNFFNSLLDKYDFCLAEMLGILEISKINLVNNRFGEDENEF